MNNPEMMEQYMKFCAFQQQMKEKENINHDTNPIKQNETNEPNVKKEDETSMFEKLMKEKFKLPTQTQTFIPFDIDNFNGDGLQKEYDLAYQNECKALSF